jgi:hypothetical protein
MGSLWKKIKFKTIKEHLNLPLTDCLYSDLFLTLLSDKAVGTLNDLLTPNGELLEIQYDTEENMPFFVFNCTCVLDVLDEEKSRVSDFPKQDSLFFDGRLLNEINPKIFLLKQKSRHKHLFVTDAFVDRVKNEQLTGFRFREVWSS